MSEQLLSSLFVVKLTSLQVYLLWFLLGSFTVATLSDLKHLSAQREFLEIWVLFILVMLGSDIYRHTYVLENSGYLFIKWGLILIVLPLYFHFLRKVAGGDVLAKMAACSLFPPLLIFVFLILVRIIDKLTRFIWKIWRRGNVYPFMPVILITTLILIIVFIFLLKIY